MDNCLCSRQWLWPDGDPNLTPAGGITSPVLRRRTHHPQLPSHGTWRHAKRSQRVRPHRWPIPWISLCSSEQTKLANYLKCFKGLGFGWWQFEQYMDSYTWACELLTLTVPYRMFLFTASVFSMVWSWSDSYWTRYIVVADNGTMQWPWPF